MEKKGKILFVATIENSITHEKEYEIVAETPGKLIDILMLLKHEAGFTLSVEKLLVHLFQQRAAYCERQVCITVRSE